MRTLKQWTLASVLTLGLAVPAVAQEDAEAGDAGATGQLQQSVPDTQGRSGVFVSAGFGPAFYTGSSGWSVNVNALVPVKEGTGFYVGGEVSAAFWGFTSPAGIGPNVSSGATALTVAPTALYRFSGWESIHPYIGATIGPTFYMQDVNANRENRLLLQLVARPGIFTPLSDTISLQAEGKLGLLGGDFYFNPHANISVAL